MTGPLLLTTILSIFWGHCISFPMLAELGATGNNLNGMAGLQNMIPSNVINLITDSLPAEYRDLIPGYNPSAPGSSQGAGNKSPAPGTAMTPSGRGTAISYPTPPTINKTPSSWMENMSPLSWMGNRSPSSVTGNSNPGSGNPNGKPSGHGDIFGNMASMFTKELLSALNI